MEESNEKKTKPPNPRAKANPFSALTFWWMLPIFFRGFKREFEVDDLFEALEEHKSKNLGDKFERKWNEEILRSKKHGKVPSLLRVAIKLFFFDFMLFGVIRAAAELFIRVVQPMLLGWLLAYFTPGSDVPLTSAYWYAAGVMMCTFVIVLTIHPFMMAMFHIGMKIRIGCSALVYRKALRLPLGGGSIGRVLNLMANDVSRFDNMFLFLHYLWIGPLELLLVAYLVYEELGLPGFGGVIAILLFIPTQSYLGKKSSQIRLRTARLTDVRVRETNEVISGIQVVKLFTWEYPFENKVLSARKKEMKEIRTGAYIRSTIPAMNVLVTRIATYLSVLSFMMSGNGVTAQKVFVVTAYFHILRSTMTNAFPKAVAQLAEALVSFSRVQEFLLWEEMSPLPALEAGEQKQKPPVSNGSVLWMDHVTASWTSEADAAPALTNINLHLQPGNLVAVVGPVGCGKTSLLLTVLGELTVTAGSVGKTGKISYASQEPWVFSGSVKQNVVFTEPFDSHRYRRVVRACGLQPDFQQLPHGDRSLVGERGVTLSGGQRARVGLARAVYQEADVYLLDDPLSAVDAHVGRHIFDEVIMGLLRDKAVILVTHQLQYLKDASHIIILNHGAVEAEGSFSELQSSGLDFAKLLGVSEKPEAEEEEKAPNREKRSSSSSAESLPQDKQQQKEKSEPVPVAEMRSRGQVDWDVYRQYALACGNCAMLTLVASLLVLSPVIGLGSDYWLAQWTNMEDWRISRKEAANETEDVLGNSTTPFPATELPFENVTIKAMKSESVTDGGLLASMDSYICLYIYTGLIVGTVIITMARSLLFFGVNVKAAMKLHNCMLRTVVRAPMRFFHTNPSGRIMNRFSKDVGIVDETLPLTLIECFQILLLLLAIAVMVIILNYWLVIPTVVVLVVFIGFRLVFLATSRGVKRLDGITRSPVFSHINATVQGLSTIRATQAQSILIKEFDEFQDINASAFYIFLSANRAFGWWLDMGCLLYLICIVFSFLIFSEGSVAGNVGLAVTQAIGLTGMFQWGMRQSAEVENQMTSVERMLEFAGLDQEASLETLPSKKPPRDWPENGKIQFSNVFLKYSESSPYVLKDLNFLIKPSEKVGIVGRTGAGKSSLITALFRLAEPEGCISIDGVNVGELGLHELRGNLSLIPQEPLLFSGSVRSNLDPLEEYSDAAVWEALEEVELKEVVELLPAGLTASTSEGGANFSVGQRQLLCLARAILRDKHILVLDEATANVDPQTDALIQDTIRRKFINCTVLTIAHRLHTVMDSDRIFVMEEGRIVESGSPSELLRRSDGRLYHLAQESGAADELLAIAETHIKVAQSKGQEGEA